MRMFVALVVTMAAANAAAQSFPPPSARDQGAAAYRLWFTRDLNFAREPAGGATTLATRNALRSVQLPAGGTAVIPLNEQLALSVNTPVYAFVRGVWVGQSVTTVQYVNANAGLRLRLFVNGTTVQLETSRDPPDHPPALSTVSGTLGQWLAIGVDGGSATNPAQSSSAVTVGTGPTLATGRARQLFVKVEPLP